MAKEWSPPCRCFRSVRDPPCGPREALPPSGAGLVTLLAGNKICKSEDVVLLKRQLHKMLTLHKVSACPLGRGRGDASQTRNNVSIPHAVHLKPGTFVWCLPPSISPKEREKGPAEPPRKNSSCLQLGQAGGLQTLPSGLPHSKRSLQ